MNIVVIGGSGLIGTKLVKRLRQERHEVRAASPDTGVDTITGEGLAEALAGAQVVVDVSNPHSLDDEAVLEFSERSGRNLLAAEAAAGVEHHVALSIVGTDRLSDSPYLSAKMVQENLIKAAKIPYTILRSTQLFEIAGDIAQANSIGRVVCVSPALVQPIASDDVVAALTEIALAPPGNCTRELAGPETLPLDEFVRRFLSAKNDKRPVVGDIHARYFGAQLDDRSLTPGKKPRIGSTRFEDWLGLSFPHDEAIGLAAEFTRSSL